VNAPPRVVGLRILTAATLGGAVLASPSRVEAYCRTSSCDDGAVGTRCEPATEGDCGVPIAWPTSCVGYSLASKGTEQLPLATVRSIVARAFATWSSSECEGGPVRIGGVDLGDVDCSEVSYDPDGPNANLVVFRDEAWPYAQSGALALTTVTYVLDTGAIRDADLEINSASATLSTSDTSVEVDLESIVTHEVGHMLGLSHTNVDDATMTTNYPPRSTTLRSLEPDDVAGLCSIYPANRAVACMPTPRGGLLDACASEGTGSGGSAGDAEEDGGCSIASAGPSEARRDRSAELLASLAILLAARVRRAERPRRSSSSEPDARTS
jgi:hypothetical protein